MGYEAKSVKGQMLPFEEARDIVQQLNLTSTEEWKAWRKSEPCTAANEEANSNNMEHTQTIIIM